MPRMKWNEPGDFRIKVTYDGLWHAVRQVAVATPVESDTYGQYLAWDWKDCEPNVYGYGLNKRAAIKALKAAYELEKKKGQVHYCDW